MPTVISPQPWLTLLDDDGRVVPNGQLALYEAGTSTPVTVYTDSLSSVPHPWPITLDSSGRIPGGLFILPEVAYKFVLHEPKLANLDLTGAIIKTQDNVMGHGGKVNVSGGVPDSGQLPETGEPGDAFISADDGHLWIWDDVQGIWVDVGPVQGPPGQTGPVGPMGPQGPIGETGAQGEQGIQGIQGIPGDTGPQGEKGDTGATGAMGPQGVPGQDGATGPAGAAGEPGPVGPEGPQGPGGEGQVGPSGPPGPQGETGLQGPIGPIGPEGPEGPQGEQGVPGGYVLHAATHSPGGSDPLVNAAWTNVANTFTQPQVIDVAGPQLTVTGVGPHINLRDPNVPVTQQLIRLENWNGEFRIARVEAADGTNHLALLTLNRATAEALLQGNVRVLKPRPEVVLQTPGDVPKARFASVVPGGRVDITTNLSYDGLNWNRDDPTKAGSLLTIFDAVGGMGFYDAPAGANPAALQRRFLIDGATGNVTFDKNVRLAAAAGIPRLQLMQMEMPPNQRMWEIINNGGSLFFQAVDDAVTTAQGYVMIERNGVLSAPWGLGATPLNANNITQGTVPYARLDPNIAYRTINNTFTQPQTLPDGTTISGNNGWLYLYSEGSGVNARRWRMLNYGDGPLQIEAMTDDGSVAQGRITLGRDSTLTAPGGLGGTPLNAGYLSSGTVPNAALATNIARLDFWNSTNMHVTGTFWERSRGAGMGQTTNWPLTSGNLWGDNGGLTLGAGSYVRYWLISDRMYIQFTLNLTNNVATSGIYMHTPPNGTVTASQPGTEIGSCICAPAGGVHQAAKVQISQNQALLSFFRIPAATWGVGTMEIQGQFSFACAGI